MKNAILTLLITLFSCNKQETTTPQISQITELRGTDISFLPELRKTGISCFNSSNQKEDMLHTLKNSGVNTIRLRLWKQPNETTSDFNQVKLLAQECKNLGLKVLLSVHYSDTWADPANQIKPKQWQNIPITQLNDSIFAYTNKIMTEIKPDFIQIGNEINGGFLFPEGNFTNLSTMKSFIKTAIQAVRLSNKSTKIILHFAGFENAIDFYSNFKDIDYDIIGLSYYVMWHGRNLDALKTSLTNLGTTFNKKTLIVETSYPFTLAWNDWTDNVIGLDNQLISDYPATPDGQSRYLAKIKEITRSVPNCLGFCYWGGEWISYHGNMAKNGSSWENQAFWDFNNKALPILENY